MTQEQETERGIVIVSQPDIENPTKERAILHAQQTSTTLGKRETPVVNTLQMVVHPQFIQTGQQRRRERRKQERKNKK